MSGVSSKLDYKVKEYSHPKYKMHKIVQQNGGTNVTITTSGGQESVFEIPVNAYNFSKSYIRGRITIASPGANRNNYTYNSQLCLINEVQLTNGGGTLVSKPETRLDDFLTNSSPAYITSFLNKSNSQGDDVRGYWYNADQPSQITTGIQYFDITSGTLVAPLVGLQSNINFSIPLHALKNTIGEYDKDVFFGETMYLRIRWSQPSKIGWSSEFVNTPAVNVPGNPAYVPPFNNYNPNVDPQPLNVDVNLSLLELLLAQEDSIPILNAIKSQYSLGMTYRIPFVYGSKTSLSGTSQNVIVRLGPNYGKRLKKIYHAFYDPTETKNRVYDHNNNIDEIRDNIGDLIQAYGPKCNQYYTTVNNVKRQQFDIFPNKYDDYLINKERFNGSVIQDSDMFWFNYFVLDDFTEEESLISKKNKALIGADMEDGILMDTEVMWTINCQINNLLPANQLLNHYTFSVVSRDLYVGPGGMRLQ